MNKTKKGLIITTATILILILALFTIRLINRAELDDLNPLIQCDEELIRKSDVLWIIPLYQNQSIANNTQWCNYIKSFNKTLGLHGIRHTYREFETQRTQEEMNEGIKAFQECLGYKPEKFKPPQVKYAKENDELLEKNNLIYYGNLNQVTHKVYNCSNTGYFSNTLIKIF